MQSSDVYAEIQALRANTEKPIAIILQGVPASGKSTFARKYLKNFKLISSDDYIENIAKERGSTYSNVFKSVAKDAQKNCVRVFNQALLSERDLVIDRTNTSVKSRRKWIPHLRKYVKVLITFDVDRDTIIDRASKRVGKEIPVHVINSMIDNMESADVAEGFDFQFVIKE